MSKLKCVRGRLTRSLLLTGLVAAFAGPAWSAPPLPVDLPQQVGQLESRFFFHPYASDPLEKRLERLELLVFGQTQAGNNGERLTQLKKMIADKDRASAQRSTVAPPVTAQPTAPPKADSSSQYPVLNTLEWRALKKTYPQDSLDQRLQRLETKLFGQPSPAMAYADRVERLQRTLGTAASDAPVPRSGGGVGPMPKARPRGQEFGWDNQVTPLPSVPFGGGNQSDISGLMSEMFRQMDQQMEQMFNMQPGQLPFRGRVAPAPMNPSPFKTLPSPRPSQPDVPPYNDPNTI